MATPKLVSMKLSSAEAKAETGEVAEMKAPSYPWGLQYTLNTEVLDKLGDSVEDYEVGEYYYLYAKCKVTGKSEHEYENSKPSRCVDIQITDMMIEEADEPKKSVGGRLYGDDDAE